MLQLTEDERDALILEVVKMHLGRTHVPCGTLKGLCASIVMGLEFLPEEQQFDSGVVGYYTTVITRAFMRG